ncbi:MAG: enoyl-CoA hydratase/isomerase family protein [Promethearchaeota archaeon]
MTEYKFWKVILEDKILWILLDRPEKRNAFSNLVGEELYQILEKEVEENLKNVRVVVYGTTQDNMMCSGADLEWFNNFNGPKGVRGARGRQASINAQNVFNKFEQLPVPVIAAIKGLNLTAGFELAMCADIIIAGENAKFGQLETKYGITPFGGGTQRLTRIVGPLKAKELIYTSRIIDAKEAKEIGLVNHVVPVEEVDAKVKEIAQEMIQNSGRAIALAKRLIQMATYTNKEGFMAESDAAASDFDSGEPFKIFAKFFQETQKKKE